MRKVTLIMAYYMNPGMLRVQYDSLRRLPAVVKDRAAVIVVDDGSPRDPAFAEDIGMPLSVFRVGKDVRWNQDACRNIGVHESNTPWLLLTDMDHVVTHGTFKHLVKGQFEPHYAYRFSRINAPDFDSYKPHPNSWFMTRQLYDKVGGYDERFAGYYGTDGDFLTRVKGVARVVQLDDVIVRYPREVVPDASTTTYTRKEAYDKQNFDRIRHERSCILNWRPLRLTFPYHRVH